MIDFKAITLSDREIIESYTLSSSIKNCDLSFANMYCWQPTFKSAWAIVDGYLLIRFCIDGGERLGYMQPIGVDGSFDFSHIIPQMAADAHSHGNRLRVIGLTREGRDSLQEEYDGEFALYNDPAFEDYIYLRERLCSLSGKALQAKRNHINQFQRLYPNFEYRPLSCEMFNECLELDCRWREANGIRCSDYTPEREAMQRAFNHFEELELIGGALFFNGQMVAFTYGSRVNHNTFAIHIEKGEREVTGCYTMINQLFAQSLPEQFIYINREEDLGIEGLRRSKLSYHPEHKEPKFTAIYLHHHEEECRALWSEVFGDEDEFIDEFIINHYSQEGMLRVTDRDNRYLSMLHIIPFESEIGRVAYIYAVATHPKFRGGGYATKLMKEAIEIARQRGYATIALIPAEEWLEKFYTQFGLHKGPMLEFVSYNNFDFGSGDKKRDRSMILPLNDITNMPATLTLQATPSR